RGGFGLAAEPPGGGEPGRGPGDPSVPETVSVRTGHVYRLERAFDYRQGRRRPAPGWRWLTLPARLSGQSGRGRCAGVASEETKVAATVSVPLACALAMAVSPSPGGGSAVGCGRVASSTA